MADHRYDDAQKLEPLPVGVVGGAMWALGIGFASLFFVLRGANQWWAALDGNSTLTQYAAPVIWSFFPGFAALAIPWPLTIWYLRRVGRWQEANNIEDASDQRGKMNSLKVMKWLGFALVGPIGSVTVLAIPIHLSISDSDVRVGHYASWRSEHFPFRDARRLTLVDGYRMKDGSFHPAKDVVIDFSDRRRLRANQVGDGGTNVRDDVMRLLISKTGLPLQHSSTLEEAPLTQ